MRKVIFTLATGLFLFAGVSTSSACDGHNKKTTKASTRAEAKVEKKECTVAEKQACASKKAMANGEKSCCASKKATTQANKQETKPTKPEAKL